MLPVRAYLRLLIDYLRPQKVRVALLAVLLLIVIALQLFNPQLIARFLDGAVAGASIGELLPFAVWFMIIAVIQQGFSVLATFLAEDVGWTATNQMRRDLAEHVMNLDMTFHKQHTPGELIERIDGDVTALSNFFSAFAIKVLANFVLIIGILLLLWRENVWVGFGLTMFSIVAMTAMLLTQAKAVPWWTAARAQRASFFGFLGEQLGGTEDTKSNGGVGYMMYRFTNTIRVWRPSEVRGRFGFSILWGSSIASYIVGTALVFWLGSVLFGRGDLTIGSVYLVFHYTEMTRHPMEQIRAQMEDFQKAGAGIARVEELFDRSSALPRAGSTPVPSGPLSIEFEGVTFAYDDDGDGRADRVLHDITCGIGAGRVVGVLGRSGSGKTTLARLLTRLYDPQEGVVRLGGVAAPDADVEDLRHHVGMVTQDVQLFRASVRDNLTFFDPSVGDDHLRAVIDELELTPWLDSLSGGLDTELGAGGSGLSAGQAQLLAFTRIFLKNPGLVILDEASSRLDPATEAMIERAVGKLLTNRTGFIIAHRLDTVTRADDILIIENGRIIEYGPRTELENDPESHFSQLLATGMEEVLA